MKKKISFTIMGLVLALVAVSWGIGGAGADSRPPAPAVQTPQQEVTITDAAGRVHKLRPHMKAAQRKAAAQRLKASASSGEVAK
jgi:hypothetical protein